jgi:type I restriction enzyme M protein
LPAPFENEEKVLHDFLPLLAIKGKEGKTQQNAYVTKFKEVFAQFEKLNKAAITKRIKQIPLLSESLDAETKALYEKYVALQDKLSEEKDSLKEMMPEMYQKVKAKYESLTEKDIRHLVVDCKWRGILTARTDTLLTDVCQKMTTDMIALRDRYAHTLPNIENRVNDLREKVNASLESMGIKL